MYAKPVWVSRRGLKPIFTHRLHHTSSTLLHFRIAYICGWFITSTKCVHMHVYTMNHHTSPEHSMSIVKKITVSLYAITV